MRSGKIDEPKSISCSFEDAARQVYADVREAILGLRSPKSNEKDWSRDLKRIYTASRNSLELRQVTSMTRVFWMSLLCRLKSSSFVLFGASDQRSQARRSQTRLHPV
jgi:hypothetical protein